MPRCPRQPRCAYEARLAALVLAVFLVVACEPAPLPEFGNVLVEVDTDVAVPALVSRLRVDIFEGDSWVSSRAFALHAPRDWPASFVLFHPGEETRTTLVRLRAYADGTERDYLGERYVAPPSPTDPDDEIPPEAERTLLPRLAEHSGSPTPASEPSPTLAIDRLLRVETRYGEGATVHVVLRGDCFGVMANLAQRRSCVDAARRWESADEPSRDAPAARVSLVGSFPAVPSASKAPRPRSAAGGGELLDEEVVVPGGAFVLGSRTLAEVDDGDPTRLSASPERLAIVGPLLVDRYEVTVARFRQALARGFVPTVLPLANEGPLATTHAQGDITESCTFSREPRAGLERREGSPLNCIGHAPAREYCRFGQADLLTEAEWEYVAMVGGRDAKEPYPWGAGAPDCDAIIQRGTSVSSAACLAFGPAPVVAGSRDETPLGVHGLFGNVAEWVVDAPLSYASAAYRRAPLDAQKYDPPAASRFVVRGQSWAVNPGNLTSSARAAEDATTRAPTVGFRCARSAR